MKKSRRPDNEDEGEQMNEPNSKQPHPENRPQLTGPELALEMTNQLARLNINMEAQLKMAEQQLALTDELNGRLEVLTRACEILADMKDQGKIKVGFLEFAEAMTQADLEIMGEEEEGDPEEEEEEDGDIPRRR